MSCRPKHQVDDVDFDQFIRDLRHDFRSHLWVVSFCLEQLQKDYGKTLDPEMLSFLSGSMDAVQAMRQRLEDLSRFESHSADTRPADRRQPSGESPTDRN